MFALLLLAALGQTPAGATACREWRPLNTDPRYEVSGRMVGGVFRYNPASRRIRSRAPAANYGVNLDPAEGLIVGSVRGTDYSLARDLAEVERRFEAKQKPNTGAMTPAPIAPVAPSAPAVTPEPMPEMPPEPKFEDEAPCPGPYCPDRKPEPKPIIPIEPFVWETKHMITAIIVGLLGLVLALLWFGFWIGLLFLGCRWVYRKIEDKPAPPSAPTTPTS